MTTSDMKTERIASDSERANAIISRLERIESLLRKHIESRPDYTIVLKTIADRLSAIESVLSTPARETMRSSGQTKERADKQNQRRDGRAEARTPKIDTTGLAKLIERQRRKPAERSRQELGSRTST